MGDMAERRKEAQSGLKAFVDQKREASEVKGTADTPWEGSP